MARAKKRSCTAASGSFFARVANHGRSGNVVFSQLAYGEREESQVQ